jgi:p-cumate 2,3-dioxygenase subunit beta
MTATSESIDLDLAVRPGTVSWQLHHEIVQYLYYEAELLDEWRLDEWLQLFARDAHYVVPTTDMPDGDPARDLVLIHDDRFLLEQRVASLQTRTAHAEYPHSRTRRMISNVRIIELAGNRVHVSANAVVYRMRHGNVDTYVVHYEHLLERMDGDWKFVERKTIIDLEALRPQGKVSIIL